MTFCMIVVDVAYDIQSFYVGLDVGSMLAGIGVNSSGLRVGTAIISGRNLVVLFLRRTLQDTWFRFIWFIGGSSERGAILFNESDLCSWWRKVHVYWSKYVIKATCRYNLYFWGFCIRPRSCYTREKRVCRFDGKTSLLPRSQNQLIRV